MPVPQYTNGSAHTNGTTHSNGVKKSTANGHSPLSGDVREGLIQELKGQLRVDLEAELKERLIAEQKNQISGEAYRDVRHDVLAQLENETQNKNTKNSGSKVSPSIFTPICHPLVDEATADIDGYYLAHWGFPDEKAREKFVAAGFSRVTCLYFPKALNSRIRYACSLLTILFLIDDQLEYMSFAEGKAYNESLMPLCRGDIEPDRSVPVQWMMYDLWEDMRQCDYELARSVEEPVFQFMRAQTDRQRLTVKGLGAYLVYRQADVGQALLAALMRFSMALHITPSDHESITPLEQNTGRHIAVINDIYSYEKELLTSHTAHEEGGYLCSAVPIFADEANVPVTVAKSSLYELCRAWEAKHNELLAERESSGRCSEDLSRYMNGLEYHMSGNESWSMSTKRYSEVS